MAEAPEIVAQPAPVDALGEGAGLPRLHHVVAEIGIAGDAGVLALQPLVPPAKALLKESEARFRHGEMRVLVRPGSDDGLARHPQPLHQARHGVGIGVVPAAHHQGGGLDGGEILTDRAMLPVGVAVRMLEPGNDQEGLILEPLHPHRAPAVADDRGVGGPRGIGEHGCGPAHHLVQHRAALIVHVVFIAVVGGADGDDGLERRGLPRCHLQRVEAAPGNPEHADLAGAPCLLGDPVDHLQRVVLLLLGIFVQHHAV